MHDRFLEYPSPGTKNVCSKSKNEKEWENNRSFDNFLILKTNEMHMIFNFILIPTPEI